MAVITLMFLAVVVAQLAERSVVRIQSSAKFIEHLFTVNCIEKAKIKKKEAGNGPFKKVLLCLKTVSCLLIWKIKAILKKPCNLYTYYLCMCRAASKVV